MRIVVRIGQRTGQHTCRIFRLAVHETGIGHAVVGRLVAVGDGLSLRRDGQGSLANGKGRAVHTGQLVVARLVAGQRGGRGGVARPRVGLSAADGDGDLVIVDRPRRRSRGSLRFAGVGQRRMAPHQADFLLIDGQRTGDEADFVVV